MDVGSATEPFSAPTNNSLSHEMASIQLYLLRKSGGTSTSKVQPRRRKRALEDTTCNLVVHNSARSRDGVCRLMLKETGCGPGQRWVYNTKRRRAECRRDPCQGWERIRIGNKCLIRHNSLCHPGMDIYEDDQGIAYCDCMPTFIHYPRTKKCYPAFTQGYCRSGRMLVMIRGRRRCVSAEGCANGEVPLTSAEGTKRCYKVCLHAQRVCPSTRHVVVDPISLQVEFSESADSDRVYLRYMALWGCNAGGIYHRLGCNRVENRQIARKTLFKRNGINDMMTIHDFIDLYGRKYFYK